MSKKHPYRDENGTFKPVNTWHCVTCNLGPMPFEDMQTHLRDTHKMTEAQKFKKQMLMHADGTDFFIYQWSLKATVDGKEIELVNHTVDERSAESRMYWE